MGSKALYILILVLCACANHSVHFRKVLCEGSVKYWQARTGYNWAFFSDGSFLEYRQEASGRQRVSYGDMKLTQVNYTISGGDSLVINAGANRLWAYKLVRITPAMLVVTSGRTGWGVDTLVFEPSTDQTTIIQ